MNCYILGINAYHGDASAAIVVDGHLVAAVEEERFNRIKHWAGFPAQSIRYCLEAAGIQRETWTMSASRSTRGESDPTVEICRGKTTIDSCRRG